MKKPMFAIRDSKVGFLSPAVDVNTATARRNFAVAVRDGDSLLHSMPSDFALYHVADWDDETGLPSPLPTPQLVCYGDDFVED